MATRTETLVAALQAVLGDKLASVTTALGEVTAERKLQPRRLLAQARSASSGEWPLKSVVHAESGG